MYEGGSFFFPLLFPFSSFSKPYDESDNQDYHCKIKEIVWE